MSALVHFWSRLARRLDDGWIHPDDEPFLSGRPHAFNFDFPPPAFIGDVTKARVLILMMNGGYGPLTALEFDRPGAEASFLSRLHTPSTADWSDVAPYYRSLWVYRAGLLQSGLAAIVNACAYRSEALSREVETKRLAQSLPSMRAHREWLKTEAVSRARRGDCLIIVKRASLWNVSDLPSEVLSLDGAPRASDISRGSRAAVSAYLGITTPTTLAEGKGLHRAHEPNGEEGFFYRPFWQKTQSALARRGIVTDAPNSKNWLRVPVASRTTHGGGVHFSATFKRGGRLAIDLTIQLPAEESDALFHKVEEHKPALQKELGELEWYALPENQRRLIVMHSGLNKEDVSEEVLLSWLTSKIPLFVKALTPILS